MKSRLGTSITICTALINSFHLNGHRACLKTRLWRKLQCVIDVQPNVVGVTPKKHEQIVSNFAAVSVTVSREGVNLPDCHHHQ